jgi:hypothetical protein
VARMARVARVFRGGTVPGVVMHLVPGPTLHGVPSLSNEPHHALTGGKSPR